MNIFIHEKKIRNGEMINVIEGKINLPFESSLKTEKSVINSIVLMWILEILILGSIGLVVYFEIDKNPFGIFMAIPLMMMISYLFISTFNFQKGIKITEKGIEISYPWRTVRSSKMDIDFERIDHIEKYPAELLIYLFNGSCEHFVIINPTKDRVRELVPIVQAIQTASPVKVSDVEQLEKRMNS